MLEDDEQFAHTSDQGTFFGLPAANSFWWESRITGLWRLPTNAPIERKARTRERPSRTVRWPRRVQLSWLKGATSVRAVVCRRSSVANSGR